MKNNEAQNISRRSLIKRLGVTAAGTAAYGAGAQNIHAADFTDTDIFCLCGDRWHNFDYIRSSLTHSIIDGMGKPVFFSPNYQYLNRAHLDKYKALIILMDGMIFPGGYKSPYAMFDNNAPEMVSEPPVGEFGGPHEMWIQPEQGADLKSWVEDGGSVLFMHNATYISGANEDFRDVAGAKFAGHTEVCSFRIRIDNNSHPITQGVNDFVITEEQHFVFYDGAPESILAHAVNESGITFEHNEAGNMGDVSEAVWAHEYGDGRVCFMSPGHTAFTFWNPEFVKMQQNAVRWLLRES